MKNTIFASLCLLGTLSALAIAEPAERDIPDPHITPGEVASSDFSDVCGKVDGLTYSKRHRLSQTPETKRDVFAAYHVPWSDARLYEDDHIIPLCLGGADTHANRWPQHHDGVWNSQKKDDLETYACHAVCYSHSVNLPVAQSWFTPDWRVAYCQEISPSAPECASIKK